MTTPAESGLTPSSNEPVPVSMSQPKGLWVLFITEMWERFSYYGMRALLVLYLIRSTSSVLENGEPNTNPGFGWTKDSAYLLYGIYTWAVYVTPILGGWIADRFLGTHRSMLLGGWIIAAGHVTLAMTEFFGVTAGEVVTLQSSPGALVCFVAGLVLIVIGTGFFKPCVSVMVGQMYDADDPRRDSGFTIFYMGINLGATLAPLVAGTLGEKVGWHWGFGSAAVGMLLGLVFYQRFRPRYLGEIGMVPGHAVSNHAVSSIDTEPAALTREAWHRIGVIFVLGFFGNIFFWTVFEQAGSSMNVFAEDNTDRTLGGFLEEPFPATWYQSVNPIVILICAPIFTWLWGWLTARRMNPSTPMKFAIGLYLVGLASIAMVAGSLQASREGIAGAHWLLIAFTVMTWGELCLSPVGLSMVTKLSPPRLQSLMMGVWFFSMSLCNLLAGILAYYSEKFKTGEISFIYPGLAGFFTMLVILPIVAGILIALIAPVLKRMMHGVQ